MTEITKCSGIGCAVRNYCLRYRAERSEVQSWSAFYADASFRPADGCEYYWPAPGIQGRIQADFDKARE